MFARSSSHLNGRRIVAIDCDHTRAAEKLLLVYETRANVRRNRHFVVSAQQSFDIFGDDKRVKSTGATPLMQHRDIS